MSQELLRDLVERVRLLEQLVGQLRSESQELLRDLVERVRLLEQLVGQLRSENRKLREALRAAHQEAV